MNDTSLFQIKISFNILHEVLGKITVSFHAQF